jgi:pyrimidine operon attenuation protein/uracil phosphoribosyltransferase
VRPSHIPFDVADRNLLLVDDVLYTGRTTRAALNELFDHGRPACIELAVLIDRGGRELPVAPTATGRTIEVPANISVVLLRDDDRKLHLTLERKSADA